MTSSPRSPYSPFRLSVVVTARNDDHGGGMLKRLQAFVTSLFSQASRFEVPIELVLVEWNPPSDRRPLVDAIDWSKLNKPSIARLIQVPHDVHASINNSDKLALFQMIAKNVGIRRASADFILATNVDVILSDPLFRRITRNRLKRDALYRAMRVDLGPELGDPNDTRAIQKHCASGWIRENAVDGTRCSTDGRFYRIFPKGYERTYRERVVPKRAFWNMCGDFQLAHRDVWERLRGYPEFETYSVHIDCLFECMALYAGLREVRAPRSAPVYHIEHENGFAPERADTPEWNARLETLGALTYQMHKTLATCMDILNGSLVFNNHRWGVAGATFREDVVTAHGEVQRAHDTEPTSILRSRVTDTQAWFRCIRQADAALLPYRLYALESYVETLTQLMPQARERRQTPIRSSAKPIDRLVVFGTGSGYRLRVAPFLRALSRRPDAFVDNDSKKHGAEVDGVPVHPVEWLNSLSKDGTVVVIATMYYAEACEQLTCLGWREGEHFCNGFVDLPSNEVFLIVRSQMRGNEVYDSILTVLEALETNGMEQESDTATGAQA